MAQNPPTLGIFSDAYQSPYIADPSLTPNNTFVLDVNIVDPPPIIDSNNGGVSAFDITVTFDPTILNATSASWQPPLCPASDGCLLDPSGGLSWNVLAGPSLSAGLARLAMFSFQSSSPPFNEIGAQGIVFRIQFKVVGIGSSTVSISPADIDGPTSGVIGPIFHGTVDGSFDNTPPFLLYANPSSGAITPGHSVSSSVTALLNSGSSQNVTFSITGLPSQASGTFKPSFGFYTITSDLNITTSTSTPAGTYRLKITASCLLCPTLAGTGFNSTVVYLLTVNIVDIAVMSVTPSTLEAVAGQTVGVSVGVTNLGSVAETLTINLLANQTTVATKPGVFLAAQASQTLTLNWDTTGSSLGSYSMSAQVPVLPGEVNTSNNVLSQGTVKLVSDFKISLDQAAATVFQGKTGTVIVMVSLLSSSAEQVTLAVTGYPGGVTGSFDHATGTPSFNAVLTINTALTAAPGTYTLQISGTSILSGARVTSLSLTISSGEPIPAFSVITTSPVAGAPVSFDASQSSDPDGTVSIYSWDFGDGATGAGSTATHTYRSLGTYTVKLTITDNDGQTQTVSHMVTVGQASLGASGLASPLALSGIAAAIILIIAGGFLYFRRRRHPNK